jgi:hypothetical protein
MGAAASKQGTRAPSWKGHDQWKREKYDSYSSDVQGKAGELTGAAYRTAEQVPNALEGVGREINKGMQAVGLMPGDKSGATSDGSSSANYTNSSSKTGKSSQGSGRKANLKDQGKKNVRGKSSLYKKGPK